VEENLFRSIPRVDELLGRDELKVSALPPVLLRESVREELESGAYQLDIPVQICMMVNMREICRVGEGRLHHDENGFHLTGCGGKLDYFQKPEASYSLYADYFWYEIGDMLCIGDHKALYYCFPQGGGDVVAKTRLAAEELYKLKRAAKARG